MAYRKLGRTNKHRRSMLANLTRDVINNEKIQSNSTNETKANKSLLFFIFLDILMR